MRTTCPHCSHRFDVPIRQVLAEAARLAEKRKPNRGVSPIAAALPAIREGLATQKFLHEKYAKGCIGEPDGNVLSPQDLEARRLRDEAVRKRLENKNL